MYNIPTKPYNSGTGRVATCLGGCITHLRPLPYRGVPLCDPSVSLAAPRVRLHELEAENVVPAHRNHILRVKVS